MGTGWWRAWPRLGWTALARRRPHEEQGPPAEPGRAGEPPDPAQGDHETAELSTAYWHAYTQRMATVRFGDVARGLPALIGQSARLGWAASRPDTTATVLLNLASGVFNGLALFATTGVLEALFAAGPTPHRVRAALPSLVVVGVLQPLLLAVLLLAQLPGAWAAVRSARIRYLTRFALIEAWRRKFILSNLIAERRTAAELRSFTLREFLVGRVTRLAAYVRGAELRAARQQTVTKLIGSALGGVATAGVYAVLGVLLAVGWVALSVAGTAVFALRSAAGSLQQLMYAVNQCYEDGLYFSDYLTFCEESVARIPAAGAQATPPGFERITASGVTFRYPGADEPSLREVSVEIGRGEVVALVGENGSGKTTLAKILAGLYRPSAGTVRWDGTDIADVAGEPLREQIAVIAQDHGNWPLTVRDNITMGRPRDDARLAAAAGASGADTVIADLARGYDTLLAREFKDGAELSGGQWQRIAAARGFYRAAPLLIMDEPTAALDARAEYALFSSLRTLARERTVLVITHRLASVRHADRIYVLSRGRVAETGTHAELLARAGPYAELYRLQASQYDPAASAD